MIDDVRTDEQDLERFGYKQELKRSLGGFSSFAVAFSYISPSTGIFALFFLGLTTVVGVLCRAPEGVLEDRVDLTPVVQAPCHGSRSAPFGRTDRTV